MLNNLNLIVFLLLLHYTNNKREIPFEIVHSNSFYSEKNMQALEHSKTQTENKQHSIHELV